MKIVKHAVVVLNEMDLKQKTILMARWIVKLLPLLLVCDRVWRVGIDHDRRIVLWEHMMMMPLLPAQLVALVPFPLSKTQQIFSTKFGSIAQTPSDSIATIATTIAITIVASSRAAPANHHHAAATTATSRAAAHNQQDDRLHSTTKLQTTLSDRREWQVNQADRHVYRDQRAHRDRYQTNLRRRRRIGGD
jgi:hypothetical protein